jgi:hypothetical protein
MKILSINISDSKGVIAAQRSNLFESNRENSGLSKDGINHAYYSRHVPHG